MFKKCSSCGHEWLAREDFLSDKKVEILGYQVDFVELENGLILFNHSCKSTISVHAHYFVDLYEGAIFKERATGGDDCPGFCLYKSNLRRCPVKCECAFVREIIQEIKQWKKK